MQNLRVYFLAKLNHRENIYAIYNRIVYYNIVKLYIIIKYNIIYNRIKYIYSIINGIIFST